MDWPLLQHFHAKFSWFDIFDKNLLQFDSLILSREEKKHTHTRQMVELFYIERKFQRQTHLSFHLLQKPKLTFHLNCWCFSIIIKLLVCPAGFYVCHFSITGSKWFNRFQTLSHDISWIWWVSTAIYTISTHLITSIFLWSVDSCCILCLFFAVVIPDKVIIKKNQ